MSISGGKKQRIAIARAILKNSNIIILDKRVHQVIQKMNIIIHLLSKLMKNKTVIMIAHRLSSIRNVDEILVVDEGKIVERITHDELINQDGQYRYFVIYTTNQMIGGLKWRKITKIFSLTDKRSKKHILKSTVHTHF